MSNEALFILAGEVFNMAKKNDLCVWLDHGTLLGLVRDGDILPWDTDFDISVFEKDFECLKAIIVKEFLHRSELKLRVSKRYIKIFTKYSPIKIDISKYRVAGSGHQKIIVSNHPWRTARKIRGAIHFLISQIIKIRYKFVFSLSVMLANFGDLFGSAHTSEVPKKYLNSFGDYDFNGRQFVIPNNSCDYLSYRYGSDWRIPNKEWLYFRDDKSLI